MSYSNDLSEIKNNFNLILKSDNYEEINKKLTQALSITAMLICNGNSDNFDFEHDIIVSAIEAVHDLVLDAKASLYKAT